MDTRDDPVEPEPDAEPQPRWIRRTPLLPEQWWGPPTALAVGAMVIVAIGIWLQRAALPVVIPVGAVGLVAAVVLAVTGRRAYWYPSRAAAWRLHRTRVVVWNAVGVAVAVFAFAVGARTLLIGYLVAATGLYTMRRDDPTRFERRGRAVASAAVAVVAAVYAVVALTVPVVDEAHASLWIGWSILVVPVAVVVAVLNWRAASRTARPDLDGAEDVGGLGPEPGPEPAGNDLLSAPDRTAS
ncbi:hypothetical protein [Curtobacterium aurantiacum]|uniref:hypothetical protein n=1 Tax=Curtobacterium aurantiacum TaxID=3236919 RepID=UPI001BDEF4C6|nr:hypothetical protein [Curtobacterium flaccumfaciens]MBT1681128.1 hypothetical protein [Curtobacterium flaccumfaciens pv. flaccumfaciens]